MTREEEAAILWSVLALTVPLVLAVGIAHNVWILLWMAVAMLVGFGAETGVVRWVRRRRQVRALRAWRKRGKFSAWPDVTVRGRM